MRFRRIAPFLLLAAVGALTQAPPLMAANEAPAGWHPYFQKKGEKQEPMPADVKERAKIKDEAWITIGYTDYTGYKPAVGVLQDNINHSEGSTEHYDSDLFKYLSAWHTQEGAGSTATGIDEVESMVRQALGATNRFTMVERTTGTVDVVNEQDLSKSGAMKAADYLVKVTLLGFDPQKESKDIKVVGGGMGASTIGIGSVGMSGTVAWCRLNVRIIEKETGTIIQDMTVDGTAKGHGSGIGGGIVKGLTNKLVGGGIQLDSNTRASLSEAIQAAANKIAYYSATRFQDLPWRGTVAEVTGSTFYVKGGTNVGLAEGQMLKLMSRGKEVRDPDNGELLDVVLTDNGTAKVTKVTAKMATCEIVAHGDSLVKAKDIVLRESNSAAAGGKEK